MNPRTARPDRPAPRLPNAGWLSGASRPQACSLLGVHMLLAPEQAHFTALLARLLGVRRYLKIGTYTGYSALPVALALGPPTVGS
jgi:predicted O-methyltransferase YrrM